MIEHRRHFFATLLIGASCICLSNPPSNSEVLQLLGRWASGQLSFTEIKSKGLVESDLAAFLDYHESHPLRRAAFRALLLYRTDLGVQLYVHEWAQSTDPIEILSVMIGLWHLVDSPNQEWALSTSLGSRIYLESTILPLVTDASRKDFFACAYYLGRILIVHDQEYSIPVIRVLLRNGSLTTNQAQSIYGLLAQMETPSAKALLAEERSRLSTLLKSAGG